MRERKAQRGRCAQCGGDARHHFHADAQRQQRLHFFPAPAKHEGIAPFQARHAQTRQGLVSQTLANGLLRPGVMAGPLAHINTLCAQQQMSFFGKP